MTPFLKNSLIALAIIITGGLGYYLFVIQDDAVITAGSNLGSAQAEIETQEFLRRLNELKTIELSNDIFADPRFQSLRDSSRPVPTAPVGRANPFESTF